METPNYFLTEIEKIKEKQNGMLTFPWWKKTNSESGADMV